jgi:hypothetical protein
MDKVNGAGGDADIWRKSHKPIFARKIYRRIITPGSKEHADNPKGQ